MCPWKNGGYSLSGVVVVPLVSGVSASCLRVEHIRGCTFCSVGPACRAEAVRRSELFSYVLCIAVVWDITCIHVQKYLEVTPVLYPLYLQTFH